MPDNSTVPEAPLLFTPLSLRSVTVPNRAWMSPMCQYSAPQEGPDAGVATDWHLVHYASRAVGGTGMVMLEVTAVSPEGRISAGDLGLWNDRQAAALAPITELISRHGAVPAIQLGHAGRKASANLSWIGGAHAVEAGGWQPLGPGDEPFPGLNSPAAMVERDLEKFVDDMVAAARRALTAGFRALEIHGAHGYLIHQFLSPAVNRRTDAWGGSFANRTRLALAVVDAVRAVWPDELPLLFRISATDWLEENGATGDDAGWTADQTVALAKELGARGVDLIDVSSGGALADVPIPTGPGYQVPYAARVRNEAGVPSAAVGMITEPLQAEQLLAAGQADAVLLGRALLRDPYWARHAALGLGAQTTGPLQYHRA
ncbi:NADH:flavin oxidoreductase/NADH oxidase [Allostreptomyces psammosilenae]|uniref:2,4-dienoyl-CoA reductase-like NADH-dependent reductase (Old Yellow Enzyme family) n=1 Tax=Allostreptomyces psammosilenae TaxID=1892865 RepID=A0A853A086_9ACTN|nr:NADH:flavin oxidoreductase/NADH oxidase [Allostreptomyces psammosilenae]NYI06344.1 2,4-dienoyl-CoA reductase-like NADH-dependent reductase (Old Yellow Enzyme family) [Allostreptomyces psammosilenae]